jgi:alkylhydroperoxidase family enzyme
MAHLPGTADEIRARVPAVLEAHEYIRDDVLRSGVANERLKELCFRFLAGEDVEARNERERAALAWAHAIAWDSDRADDDLWRRLHGLFGEQELVDLGCAIGFELGRQHFERTLGLPVHATTS